jgi:hypothetical protein
VMTARLIVVTTSAVTAEMIDVARTTRTATRTIARSDHRHHHLNRATPMVCSSQPAER